uniref:Uncharacterized protein n=1 Tax=Oryza meridionalis TaxID=40149 RepID=A0A0E0EBP6_9ORYZ
MATIADRRRISCEFERRRRRSRRPNLVTIATTGRDAARRFATTADATAAAAAAAAAPSRERERVRVHRRVVLPPASYRPRHATALDVKRSPWIQYNDEGRSAAVFARAPATVPSGRPASAGAGAGDGPIKNKKRAVRVRVRDRVGKIMSSISRTIHLTSRDVVKHSGFRVAACHQAVSSLKYMFLRH